MKRILIVLLLVLSLAGMGGAESYLYLEMDKSINGAFEYRLPKIEWNFYRSLGKFFGQPCVYLSEFEGALVYTAPRASIFSLNHHSLEANWNLGLEVQPFWGTISIGGRQFLDGNSDGIPANLEMFNLLRLGISFP